MDTMIEGTVEPGYERVAEAFADNFAQHGDIGAAVCVYRDGVPVVDLWGGLADPDTARPWTRDTLQLVYSTTKGVLTTAAHMLVERGQLDLDAPVARYWPEFAAAGKAEIPVRRLLTHQAGLPTLERPIPLGDALAWDPMVRALAAQAPFWPPGTAHGYHLRTFGWLVGEVVRRVSGRSPGRFVAEEIAAPLGLDFYIGLPPAARERVSRLVFAPQPDLSGFSLDGVPAELRGIMAAMLDPESLMNKPITDPAQIDFNSPAVQAAEMPSSNGIGTARSLARMYAAVIGEVDGVRLLRPETVAAATREQVDGIDRVLGLRDRYGTGYMLPTDALVLGGPASFGHSGRGGSLAFADPSRGLAFAYTMNYIIEGGLDLRAANLAAALPR